MEFPTKTDNIQQELYEDIFINGIKTNYAISSIGFIKNNSTSCILKQDINTNGYYYVLLNFDNNTYSILIHKLLAEYFIPKTFHNSHLIHSNNIKTDNRIENLLWVDADNLLNIKPTNAINKCKGIKFDKFI
jgi:hypothetical protein